MSGLMTVGRRTILTPQIGAQICAVIASGAYEHVAARACGVSERTYYRWKARGQKAQERIDEILAENDNLPVPLDGVDEAKLLPPTERIYWEFWQDVDRAHAQIRATAEVWVAEHDPRYWLRVGPGRERPGQPGWTEHRKTDVEVSGGVALQVEQETAEEEPEPDQIADVLNVLADAKVIPPPETAPLRAVESDEEERANEG